MEKLDGILERITFYSDDSCYLVGRLKAKEFSDLVTIVGTIPGPAVGECLDLEGAWMIHPEYGKQFKISRFTKNEPVSKKGIENYLASGVVKGIGPATAKLFIKHFGKDVMRIIVEEPKRLKEVPGIGEKKVEMIVESYKKQQEMQQVVLFFQEYNISAAYAARIFKQLGQETIAVVRENPYRLAEEVFGVGFKTADMIACKMGLGATSSERIRASIQYVLSRGSEDGHVFLPEEDLISRSIGTLDDGDNVELKTLIKEQLQGLINDKIIICEKMTEEKCYYLAPFFFAEKGVAYRLKKIAEHRMKLETTSLDEEIAGIENSCSIKLAPRQREALEKVLDAGILVITGGPGTGKTTTINALLELFGRFHLEVKLAAPTGRAAKRMTEATGKEAKTLHRLLEFSREGETLRFKRNEENPIKSHVIIVDEVSMVDILLMYNLLKAIPPGCKLVLVGDVDQLPSVGPGNVLRDIIESESVPVTRLDTIFRQAQDSTIIVNAHRVNQGKTPYRKNKEGDFFFMEKEDPEEIISLILDLCARRLPRYQNYNPVSDIQVLTPMRRTLLGVDNLNQKLQERLNPPSPNKPELKMGGTIFRLGDKVMQVKNNYELEVFNGDIGHISYIDKEEGQVIIAYPDTLQHREVIYTLQGMEEVVLAYATSVHKSQGSEYKVVIAPVVTQHFIMLQRNLIYTAITRAKEMVILIGTSRALAIAVKNSKVAERYTLLAERLKT